MSVGIPEVLPDDTIYVYIYIYIYMYVCMFVCMYVCIFTKISECDDAD